VASIRATLNDDVAARTAAGSAPTEAEREAIAALGDPDRVAAVVIHQVTQTVNPSRVDGQTLVENYAVAAASLYKADVLDKPAAQRVIDAARAEGLALTAAEARALLA
jgi:hypothetical protein